jgi:hypothetical protein
VKRIATIILLLVSVAAAANCPFTVTCDLDGATMYKVRSEWTGIHEVGVYQHRTSDGHIHQVLVRCD